LTGSTGLDFATTIHSAQGVSADTMHGLLTGQESRQQLYTMLTRGRHGNSSIALLRLAALATRRLPRRQERDSTRSRQLVVASPSL
jgi:ATP-dependent exoDNAse (exonuclease V) alpha subunit